MLVRFYPLAKRTRFYLVYVFAFLSFSSIFSQQVWINEISYDPVGSDTVEFVEIAGTTGMVLKGYKLVFYNGSNNMVYHSKALVDTLKGDGEYSAKAIYFKNIIQNGAPDGIALVKDDSILLQFISYEGVITAADGAAIGKTSIDIGVSQIGENNSLQLTGTSVNPPFVWEKAVPSPDVLNTSQFVVTMEQLEMKDASVFLHDFNVIYFRELSDVSVYDLSGKSTFYEKTTKLEFPQNGMFLLKGHTLGGQTISAKVYISGN